MQEQRVGKGQWRSGDTLAAGLNQGKSGQTLLQDAVRDRVQGAGLPVRREVMAHLNQRVAGGLRRKGEEATDFVADIDAAEPWWHERWLPFGDADSALQVIDLRPGPGYLQLGSAPVSNPADFSDAWPSLGAYLAATADALDTGGAVGPWLPCVTVDGALWWALAGDVELGGAPLRSAPKY